MNNSSRGLFIFITCTAALSFVILLSLFIEISPLQAQTSREQWDSFTLQRVNLRQRPSIRSSVQSVLDEGTVVSVMDEVPQWMYVYTGSNDSGWVFSEYIVPNSTLDRLPGVLTVLGNFEVAAGAPENTPPEPPGPEFTREREPEYINQEEDPDNEDTGASGFFISLVVLSLAANVVLGFSIREIRKRSSVLSDPDKLQSEYQLLKKANLDLKDQLQFAQENNARLEKAARKKDKDIMVQTDLRNQEFANLKNKLTALESTHNTSVLATNDMRENNEKLKQENDKLRQETGDVRKKIIDSSESIKQQAVRHTLAEQTAKEKLLLNDNEIESLREKLNKTESEKQRLTADSLEKSSALEKEKKSLNRKITALEKDLSERENVLQDKIEQAKKDAELSANDKISEQLVRERQTMEENYNKKLEEIKNRDEREQSVLREKNQLMETNITVLEKNSMRKKDCAKKWDQKFPTNYPLKRQFSKDCNKNIILY